MKDNFLLKSKKIIDHMAVIGVFYILVYQIKALKEIGKGVCQYLINWFLDTDMVTLKRLYIVGEQIFRIFIVIAVVLSIIMKIVQCVHERKLKNIKGENRFEKSLLKYLHDKSVSRAFLITGKWAEGYQLSKGSRFTHSLDAFYYQYQNASGNRDMIKIELNYSLRAHILEPVHRRILPEVFDDGMTIRMVAPMEIFAAKGNALISRAAARDLYDWGNLIAENLFADERDMFRKCFAFYTTISAETVNRDFDTSAIDSLKFDKIRRDLFPVLSKKDNFKLDERKQQAKDYIADLMQLTEREQEYMERFIAKEYVPELLFDDEEIVGRIKEHPMAIWKCLQ